MSDSTIEPTLFKNKQWAVTRFGIEAVDGGIYEIRASLLTKMTDRGQHLYHWPVHMAEKNWVNIKAFFDAFYHALEIHCHDEAIEEHILIETCAKAFYIARLTAREERRTRAASRRAAMAISDD